MKIHHIAITVTDLEKSIDFYEKNFSFKVTKRFEKEGSKQRAALMKLGENFIELWQFEDMRENKDDLQDIKIKGIRHLALGVKNLNDTVSGLEKKGLQCKPPKMGSSGQKYSFTKDLDGIPIELYGVN